MAFRRSCALAVLLGLFTPGLTPLLALTSHAAQGCSDHVCECARRCPPKRSAASDCHGARAAQAECSMRGACRHDQTLAPALASTSYLAPEVVAAGLTLSTKPLTLAPEAPLPVGFSRIDPHPPRTV